MSARAAAASVPEVSVALEGRALVARFRSAHRVCSWAIVGGGLRTARAVAWVGVRDDELRPPVDARAFLRARLRECAAADAVGLLTSRTLDTFVDVTREHGGARARAIATVGLGNALRAGDPPGPAARIGTINVLCRVDVALHDDALLEAMSIATEARTCAVLDAAVPSRRTGLPATGTGTDCIVIACPARDAREAYAGKHTRVGHLVGASVMEAVGRAAAAWKRERGLT
jgi:adenosylcobinamide amidohydrolase